jgi:hypothetical protein
MAIEITVRTRAGRVISDVIENPNEPSAKLCEEHNPVRDFRGYRPQNHAPRHLVGRNPAPDPEYKKNRRDRNRTPSTPAPRPVEITFEMYVSNAVEYLRRGLSPDTVCSELRHNGAKREDAAAMVAAAQRKIVEISKLRNAGRK